MTSGKFDCLIVLGTAWGQGGVTRDLLVGGKGEAIVEAVRNALEKSSEPCLQLQVGHNSRRLDLAPEKRRARWIPVKGKRKCS